MGITLGELLRSEQRTFKMDIGQPEPLKITYYSTGLTLECVNAVQRALATKQLEELGQLLAPIIAHWDITVDDTGEMLPITPEVFAKLPLKFVGQLWNDLGEDVNPQRRTAEPSGGGSFSGKKRRQPGAQSGTSSSEPEGISASPPGN